MRIWKPFLAALLLLAAILLAARADAVDPEALPFDLRPDQLEQVQQAQARLDHAVGRIESAVGDGSLEPQEGRDLIRRARREFERAFAAVLTPEQLEQWHDQREDAEEPVNDAAPGRESVVRWAAEIVGLTEAQVASLLEAEADLHDEEDRVQAEVRSGALLSEEARALLGVARHVFNDLFEAALTPTQLQAWQDHLRRLQDEDPPDEGEELAADGETETGEETEPDSDRPTDREQPRTDETLARRVGRIVELSAEQVEALLTAEGDWLGLRRRIEAAEDGGDLTSESAREHRLDARARLDSRIAEILTENQLAAWRQSQTDRLLDGAGEPADSGEEDQASEAQTLVRRRSWAQVKLGLR
jgi:hypothetical protein